MARLVAKKKNLVAKDFDTINRDGDEIIKVTMKSSYPFLTNMNRRGEAGNILQLITSMSPTDTLTTWHWTMM